MAIGRRGILRLAGWAAGIGLVFALPPEWTVAAEQTVTRELRVAPPRALAPGEAFALVIETGSLAEGDVLIVRDVRGEALGSVVGGVLSPNPQKQIIALIREVEGDAIVLRVEVMPAGDDNTLRVPFECEFHSVELVPIEVDP